MILKELSLKVKLVLFYVCVLFLSFFIIGYSLNKNLEENSLRELRIFLTEEAKIIALNLDIDNLKTENTVYLNKFSKALSSIIQNRITIIDVSGKVLLDTDLSISNPLELENHANRPEVRKALRGENSFEIRYSPTIKVNLLYVAVPLLKENKPIGVIRISMPLVQIKQKFETLRNAISFSFVIAFALSVFLGFLFINGITKPLNRIIYSAKKFSKGELKHKILVDSSDELGELARVLNEMSQNIEDKIKEIELQNQHLAAILQSMVEGIIVVDKDSRVISVNRPAEEIFEIKQEEVKDKLFLEVVSNNEIDDVISEVLRFGSFKSKELSLVWPIKKVFKLDASPIFENKEITGCLLVVHDFTEIRKLEVMRKDFVANVSHELKTPLTTIKGFVDTLKEGAFEDKKNALNFLNIISEHTLRLENLINDLLSLSHIESKEIILKKTFFDICALVDNVLKSFQFNLDKNNIIVENKLNNPLLVFADKDKITQVINNLVDNAMKFNKENGSIKIYSLKEDSFVKIFIEDSGIGIPKEDLPRIFERFYRVDKARSRDMGGTGLGLSIVKHIVELHNGSVGVDSIEGSGSKFYFILPLAA
jgi:two-component system phosphate regulon sensor histidine kinase PhoR